MDHNLLTDLFFNSFFSYKNPNLSLQNLIKIVWLYFID